MERWSPKLSSILTKIGRAGIRKNYPYYAEKQRLGWFVNCFLRISAKRRLFRRR